MLRFAQKWAERGNVKRDGESGSQVRRSAHDERMDLYAEAPSCDSYLFTVRSAYLGECRGCDILSKELDL